jgi:hypothetical protein
LIPTASRSRAALLPREIKKENERECSERGCRFTRQAPAILSGSKTRWLGRDEPLSEPYPRRATRKGFRTGPRLVRGPKEFSRPPFSFSAILAVAARGFMQTMDEKVRAIESLKKQGHSVVSIFLGGRKFYQIDGTTTIKPSEMRKLAGGVYSWEELEKDLLERRRAEEQSESS